MLGRRGSLTAAMRELGALAPEERRRAGAALNAAKDGSPRRSPRPRARLGRAALDAAARHRARRCDPAGAVRRHRPHPSDQPDHRRDRRDLRRDGVRRRRGAAYRGGFLQFHRAQHPARAPGAAGARHLLSAGAAGRHAAWCCAPTPRRCRSARCWRRSRRSGSSCPAAPSAATTTRRIRRCSIRSRAWSSTGRPIWAI